MHILVVNCGSATLKYKLFEAGPAPLKVVDGATLPLAGSPAPIVADLVQRLPRAPDVIAHRIVHGGDHLGELARIDARVLAELRGLAELAPLHNAPAVAVIEAMHRLGVPQVAAFDSAFHRTIPEHARRYALPPLSGVRRFGFHGWSHRYVTERYAELTGSTAPTIVSLHLGNGCSAAAIAQGRSVDTSMGYTPLEGLVMATRAGDLDPGILLHLLREGMTPERLDALLNREAGLRGLAGTSDMRALLDRTDPEAALAVEIFCYRARKYVGAYLAALGGAEAVVFTGGIGENAPAIRGRICDGLAWAGLTLDAARNLRGETRISTDDSTLAAFVIPTDEESLIARETLKLTA